MKLSIVVPVYNEARILIQVLDRLFQCKIPADVEWIFIDDCSTDSSREILEAQQKKYGYQLILQPRNFGKGAAIARAVSACKGDYILIQDADFEYDPSDIPALLQPILDGKADVVYGSRFKKSAFQVHRTYHYFVNRILTLLSNLLSGLYLTDMETCYKVLPRDLFQAMQLTSTRFGIEVEITAYIGKVRTRIFEIPISYYPRTRLQGKKIGWKDGVAALWHLFRYNQLVDTKQAFRELPARFDPNTGA